MAIQLQNTRDYMSNGVKILVYGLSGVGKTCLIPTLPNCLGISAEGGLLSIRKANIDYIEIRGVEQLEEAYQYACTSEYESIAVDSISEIAEAYLRDPV
jgi:hypothetical protein